MKARFLLLLMATFAIYNGFIYNDCMSIPVDIFGTKYEEIITAQNTTIGINPTGEAYPFGFDPF